MKSYEVIVSIEVMPHPLDFEMSAALILAKHFQQNVVFIPKAGLSTPDVKIGNILWEIKSPTGGGKRTIQHQIQRALTQSNNIVFDARRTKLHITKIRNDLRKHASKNKAIKRLILIEKNNVVVIVSPFESENLSCGNSSLLRFVVLQLCTNNSVKSIA